MWITLLIVLVLMAWGLVAMAACMISGRAARMEEIDEYVDATASELLTGITVE